MTDKHPKKTKEETVSKDQYLRLAADFDNFRKKASEDKEYAIEFGKKAVVLDILDTLDTLEIAKNHDEWTEGLGHAVKNFMKTLKQFHGVERMNIQAGLLFDPTTMEAISTVPDGESNTVQSVQRTGWIMHKRVIRPARVIVYQ